MRRSRLIAVNGAACLAFTVTLVLAGFASASPATTRSATASTHAGAAKATIISVTAGKPTEFAFKVSKFSNLPAGTFTFTVKDGGVAFHTFEICTAPVKTAGANSCVGKVTKTLHPGQTATLTVTLKKGIYEFLCSLTGHAKLGMKGLLGVGVAVTEPLPPKPTTTTTSTTTTKTTTTTTTTTGGGGGGGGGGTTTTTGGGGGVDVGCPPGTPPGTATGTDGDGDENGPVVPDDGDGCL